MLGISVVTPLICIKTNTTEGPLNGFGTKETDIVLPTPPPPPQMVFRTRETDILFYFRDQANNGTSIPCEGIMTDLPNNLLIMSICISICIICSFGPTFGANADTCSLGELQYQRDIFINSYFPHMCFDT